MKKLFALLILIFVLSTATLGCYSNDDEPIYSTELSFTHEGHYYAQLNGNGIKDFEPHNNMLGKCFKCDYYFETDDLEYELKYNLVDGEPEFYYAVSKYLDEENGVDAHIEVPVTHKQNAPIYDEGDENYEEKYDPIIDLYREQISATYYPVLEIYPRAFLKSGLESIKLNEGLKTIGNEAFAYTLIEEIVIPNSVEGGIGEICVGCNSLRSAVIGDGITLLDYYNFTYCVQLRTVVLGKNIVEIRERNFFGCKSIQYLIIPKTVISIPEAEIWTNGVNKYVSVNNLFQGGYAPARGIFLEITKDEYDALYLPLLERDNNTGLTLDSITREPIPFEEFEYTTRGFVHGWCADSKLYFKGEWEYSKDGEPIPYIEK